LVTNKQLQQIHPDWNLNQVAKATGVFSRHWCNSDETALDLAVAACEKIRERNAELITASDMILFCTQSPDYWMPPNACLLQDRLGLPLTIGALDFSLACSGFVYGLHFANALVTSGSAKQVLLVTADTYSKWIHPNDRGPLTLFGDGAAVTVIAPSENGIEQCSLGTNGAGGALFCVPAGAARTPKNLDTAKAKDNLFGNTRSAEHLMMNGPAVLDFVKREIPAFVRSFLQSAGESVDSVDLVIFHQASRLGLDYLNNTLNVPIEKRFSNIATIGNTVSASLPIALRDAEEEGKLVPGMRVLLVGFGVGLSWGATIITWSVS
jgi:3-oxoacyl-[acyl-carrier-protein] synthase-3